MNRLLLLALFILILGSCSKESAPTPPEEKPVEKNFLELAWKNFETQQYDSAIANFTEAYNKAATNALRAEAITGRGWTYAYRRALARANSDFLFALSVAEITSDVQADGMVGKGFVLYALNDFEGTISSLRLVLLQRPSYSFSHDPKVTTKRVRLLLVESYYAKGDFIQAAEQMNTLNPAGAPHSTDPAILLGNILAVLNSI